MVFALGSIFYSTKFGWSEKEISEFGIMETEKSTNEDKQSEWLRNLEEDFRKEGDYDGSENKKFQDETNRDDVKQGKVELMDYADLPIEEFMKETGIYLYQDEEKENIWATENGVIWLCSDNGKIIALGIDGIFCEEEAKGLIKEEGFPYTLAGISLNDEMSYIDKTILKDACHDNGMLNEEFYSSLYLSKLGIEMLHIVHNGDIRMISAGFDQSLKDTSEHLEYIWTDQIWQKAGKRNDKLEIVQESYMSSLNKYLNSENIEQTIVCIKYPSLEIPEEPEMTKNANEVIMEAVKKIEDRTYGVTDENLIIGADYDISYMTGKFISISFSVQVKDSNGTRYLWQYCNINMEKNGEKAYISDVGISKDRILAECKSGHELGPVDTESYLEGYDTNWDQYNISPMEYNIMVKPLYEEEENWQFGERICVISIRK